MTNNVQNLWENLPVLDAADPKPLYLKLKEIISTYIINNKIPEGVLVPKEKELAHHFGVSLAPVRQAMQLLQNDGVVSKVQGRGTFVNRARVKNTINDFVSIETELVRRGLTVTNVVIRDDVVHLPLWAQCIGVSSKQKVRIIRRLKIADGQPFALENRFFPPDVAKFLVTENLSKNVGIFTDLDRFPQTRTVRAAYSVSARLISNEESKLMKVEPGTPLLVRRGIYYNEGKHPFSAGEVIFLADQIDLNFDVLRSPDENAF